MENDRVVRKLELQEVPTVLFSDIDGTLFSPNINLLTAPIYNAQSTLYLKEKHIPFIVITGRSFWRKIDRYHLSLLGVPQPDIVVTANGSAIYYLQKDAYVADFTWQGLMQSTKITDKDGKIFSWHKWEITNVIIDYLNQHHFIFQLGKGNTYLIRLRFNRYPIDVVQQIRKDILQFFPKGIRIILTEKLLWKNSLTTFSGEMLITPATAGKDKAAQYLLKNLSLQMQKPIHALFFGDATVDVPMLSMKAHEKYYTVDQHAVRPTPLARIVLEEKMKTNPHLHITLTDGPKEILWTLRPELRKRQAEPVIPAKAGHGPLHERIQSPRHPELRRFGEASTELGASGSLSPAQNNQARKVIAVFEGFLDNIVDKNLSPNEISFLGLEKLSQGLVLLHKPKGSFAEKTKGLYHYSFGNLTDILDGIRARRSDKKEENGQLVDGFADRAKEFMQLFGRAKQRISTNPEQTVHTLLAAISCALPSIARAQAEIGGKTVSERDEKGGSMIDRTKRLFLSLLFYSFGNDDQSYAKDLEIYQTNLATFQHRLSVIPAKAGHSPLHEGIQTKDWILKQVQDDMTDFQKKALERFLLYVDVLQQEDAMNKKFLKKYPTQLKAYEKESTKLAKNYFELPINKLRKKFGIPNYKLEIKKYI